MKTAIITGGGQGIGRITAHYFLTHGFRVAIWEADKKALDNAQTTFDATPDQLLFIHCDVSREEDVQQAVKQTINQFGQIDVLINNAAVMAEKPLDAFTLDDWNQGIGVNLTGSFLCAKYAAPYLKAQRGCIVNMCSTRAFQSEPNTFAYSASKGGIFALTHSLAMSLGPEIRVNCVSPGWIDVSALKTNGKPEKLRPEDHEQHPAGRVGQPDDIARLILFLTAPENNFITGQNFTVDGGMTRKMIYV